MDDKLLMDSTRSTGTVEPKSPSCLCCQFLPEDMFLPSTTTTTTEASSIPRGEASSTEAHGATLVDGSLVLDPQNALLRLQESCAQKAITPSPQNRCVYLVDTHCHAHLERSNDDEVPSIYDLKDSTSKGASTQLDDDGNDDSKVRVEENGVVVVSLSCAVEPSDWESCLTHAAQSPHRMAAIGVHPWYIPSILLPTDDKDTTTTSDVALLTDLSWLQKLEQLLQLHPQCMMGEIGLCKMAKFIRTYPRGKSVALDLQRYVFRQQLSLAIRYQRCVSIHCVDQHGILLQILQELVVSKATTTKTQRNYEESTTTTNNQQQQQRVLPPAMALHSFSGSAVHVQQLLQWEKSLNLTHPILYFGFSHSINYVMCRSDKSRRLGRQTIRSVPRDRLLAESDVHCTNHVTLGTVGAVAYIAWALDEPIELVSQLVATNGLRFLKTQLNHSVPVG